MHTPHLETSLCDDSRVREARKDLEKAKQKYEQRPTRSAFKETTKVQVKLDEAYTSADADYIQVEIDKISRLHTAKQHAAAWKTINKLSGRKSNHRYNSRGVQMKSAKSTG